MKYWTKWVWGKNEIVAINEMNFFSFIHGRWIGFFVAAATNTSCKWQLPVWQRKWRQTKRLWRWWPWRFSVSLLSNTLVYHADTQTYVQYTCEHSICRWKREGQGWLPHTWVRQTSIRSRMILISYHQSCWVLWYRLPAWKKLWRSVWCWTVQHSRESGCV